MVDARARPGPAEPTAARARARLWAATAQASSQRRAVQALATDQPHGGAGGMDDVGLYEEGVAIARQLADSNTQLLTNTLRHVAGALQRRGDDAAARRMLEEALAVARAAGDDRELAYALSCLGRIAEDKAELAAAERMYTDGLAAPGRSGDSLPISQLLLNLGRLATASGDYAQARALMNESLERATLRPPTEGEHGRTLLHLASHARREGDGAEARRRCVAILEMPTR